MNERQMKQMGYYMIAGGVLLGTVAGIFLQSKYDPWVLTLLVAAVLVAVVFLYAAMKDRNNSPTEADSQDTDDLQAMETDSAQALEPDQAREWLDDFLVKQQKGKE